MRDLFRFSLLAALALGLWACAEQRPLEGGPRDTRPPQLDSSKYSSPNFQRNFKDREIILTFDEWVQLNDAANQILISPPLKERPEVKTKRKSVILRFKEPLRENTTYTISFGEAIKDFTEGNPAKDLRQVFSTGPELDSMQVYGLLVDARTGSPMPKVGVHLYTNLEDSTPVLERPYYYTRTDEQGKFNFTHLRPDRYRILALQDQNNNYLYDLPTEGLAFWDSSFVLRDSLKPYVKLRLFVPEGEPKLLSRKALDEGTFQLKFGAYVDTPQLRPIGMSPMDIRWQVEHHGDSTVFWWHSASAKGGDSAWFELRHGADFRDTLRLEFPDPAVFGPKSAKMRLAEKTAAPGKAGGRGGNKPAPASAKLDTPKLTMHPRKGQRLHFNYPLSAIDTSFWRIEGDSGKGALRVERDPLNPRDVLLFNPSAEPKANYLIVAYPGALRNFFGQVNSDTLVFQITQGHPEDYGHIEAEIKGLDSTQVYVFELLMGTEILARETISGRSSQKFQYPSMPPGSYVLRVLHDRNRNGRWDTGSYWRKTQAEVVTDSKPTTLKANWDNEMVLDLNPPAEGEEKKRGGGGRG